MSDIFTRAPRSGLFTRAPRSGTLTRPALGLIHTRPALRHTHALRRRRKSSLAVPESPANLGIRALDAVQDGVLRLEDVRPLYHYVKESPPGGGLRRCRPAEGAWLQQ